MDGKPVLSCIVLAVECEGKAVTTIEGLPDPKTGELHPVQKGFINQHGWQCGYCTTGNVMTAKAFLDKNPNPTTDDVRQALSNNLCLCGAYEHIQLSVLEAAKLMRGG
jgi:carbon-monoxide dehydrogenase small subunit